MTNHDHSIATMSKDYTATDFSTLNNALLHMLHIGLMERVYNNGERVFSTFAVEHYALGYDAVRECLHMFYAACAGKNKEGYTVIHCTRNGKEQTRLIRFITTD